MLSSKNFKIWFAVFAVLLIVVFFALVPLRKKSERNFKRDLVVLTVSDVDKIIFQLPDSDVPMEFNRKDDKESWDIIVNGNAYVAEPKTVKSMLKNCVNMRSLRVAGTNTDRWAEFKVADTNAVHVEFFEGKKKLGGAFIGTFSYLAQQGQNAMANEGRGKMTTYVREEGDKTVHSVDGYLPAYFTKDVKYYRRKIIFKAEKQDVTRIYTQLPDGSSYDIKRLKPGVFEIDGQPIDSIGISKFLYSADNINSRDLLDDVTPSMLQGDVSTIRFEVENMPPVTVKAYKTDDENNYIFSSSMSPGVYFGDPMNRLYRMTFKPREFFLQK